MPYRRLLSLLCRRFPNRQGVVISEDVGEGAVAVAGDDGLEGVDEATEAGCGETRSLLLKKRCGFAWFAGE